MTTESEVPSPEEKKERASFRKTVTSGLSALLSTSEEGLRGRLGELKVSREWTQFLKEQGNRAREDIVQVVSREIRKAVRAIDVPGEVRRALGGMKIQVRADISFDPPDLPKSATNTRDDAPTGTNKEQQATPQKTSR